MRRWGGIETRGSLLVGLVLLGTVGTTGSLRLLMLAGLAFVAVEARHYGWGRGLSLRAAGFSGPSRPPARPGRPLAAASRGDRARGETGLRRRRRDRVGAITPERPGYWRVSVNGLPHSWVPFEGIHTLLGAIPASSSPPREGWPSSAWARGDGLGRRLPPETRSVRVFEIFASQPHLLAGVAAATDVPN